MSFKASSVAHFLCDIVLFFSLAISNRATAQTSDLEPTPYPALAPADNSSPNTKSSPAPAPAPAARCSVDPIRLAICTRFLLSKAAFGPIIRPCCRTVTDFLSRDAEICLCPLIKSNRNAVNINIDSLIFLQLKCGKKSPVKLQCA